MSNHFPIPSPPPELVRDWARYQNGQDPEALWFRIATLAARWGADQELEACVKWIEDCGYHPSVPKELRNDRRPKPPSRKEQALEAIGRLCASVIHDDLKNDAAIVRRALEALND